MNLPIVDIRPIEAPLLLTRQPPAVIADPTPLPFAIAAWCILLMSVLGWALVFRITGWIASLI